MTDKPLIPRPFQEADIAKCVSTMNEDVGALITTAPGGGKTLIATETAKRLGVGTMLIIAPQGTHMGAWKRTLVRQGAFKEDEIHILIGTAKGKKAFANLQWSMRGAYITTPQWFARQDWSRIRPDMVVFDEIHLAGAYGIATSKKLIGSGKKPGLWAKYRMGLSGTPFRNKFENAWVIARWIEPRKMTIDYWVWRLTKCALKRDPFAQQGFKVVGEKEPGELVSTLSCFVVHYQRTKCCDFHPNGFLANLPEPLHMDVLCTMTTAQAKFYNEMENSLASSLLSGEGEDVRVHAEQFIVARNMLRRAALALPSVRTEIVINKDGEEEERARLYYEDGAPSPKLDQFLADLPSYEGDHTLALTHSRQFARLAVDRIREAGYTVEVWDGKVSKTQREKVLKGFISGDIQIIVGVISAMGTGTDGLQEVCWNLSWFSRDDDASNNVQGIGRLDRMGQDKRVVVRDYVSEKTIDVGFHGKQMQKVMALEESLRKG